MSELTDFRVAVLATDGFEESELTEPVKALRDAGAQVTILSLKAGEIQGVRHDLDKTVRIKVDRTIQDVRAEQFDAVHLPGGTVNADTMRMVPEVQPSCGPCRTPASRSRLSVTRPGNWFRPGSCTGGP